MTHLRPLQIEDLDLIQQWENIPELWEVSEQRGPFSEEDVESFVLRCLDHSDFEIERWIIMKGEESIGAVDFFDYDSKTYTCGIGIFIVHSKDRLQGHACRALELALQLLRERACRLVRAIVYIDNTSSTRLFEKLHFRRGGTGLYKGKPVIHYFREIIS